MILVTGATGLVGSHLLYHLTLKNDTILATYRSKEKKEHLKKIFSFYTDNITPLLNKITWIKADITDITTLEVIFKNNNIDLVYHCAAMISFNPKEHREMHSINIQGTANIVNYCIEFNVKKLCHVSSIATLGETKNGEPINESYEWNNETNNSEYAITKNGAELEVWRGSQEGLKIVIVNPGVILGSGFTDGSNKLFSEIKKGLKYYTNGATGFVSVKDVVNAMILLMESTIKNEHFILVSENKTYKEILFRIAECFKLKKPSIQINTLGTSILWRVSYLISLFSRKTPLLTKTTAKSSQNRNSYSSDKIKRQLPNFKFEKIDTVINNVCKNY